MANNLGLVIEREYLERVKQKSFLISTILVPIIMIGIMVLPSLFLFLGKSETMKVWVVDNTGKIFNRLEGNDDIEFISASAPVDSLKANEDVGSILVIPATAIENPERGITLLSRESISMMSDEFVTSQLEKTIRDIRLESYDIPDLKEIIQKSNADVKLSTVRIQDGEDQETSSMASYFISLAVDMLLYMFIMIYGQMVMTSIVEEKTSKVLEVVVSSVRPFQLMMGKIAGVGLVAITQILIWAVLIGLATGLGAPILMGQLASDPEVPTEVMTGIGQFTDPVFLISLLINILLYFIGGFLFYSSMYAAVGSAVSNIQDASQLSTIATMPILISIMGSMAIINDPSGALAFWLSIIPFTSPMVMMARLPYGVPVWENILSLGLLYASFVGMIWVCAKIYRVGIFMNGKKPTLVEIIKWARYK
ncbi:MAG: ABC transporter permease [Muribaculaceae bacterium]|nr:ABC transporter permease [Muribaculaceae bacterium]